MDNTTKPTPAARILWSAPRPGGAALRLTADRERIDLRVWFQTGGGEMSPSKRGFELPLEAAPSLLAALANLLAEGFGSGHESKGKGHGE